jgi:hypothetical protein
MKSRRSGVLSSPKKVRQLMDETYDLQQSPSMQSGEWLTSHGLCSDFERNARYANSCCGKCRSIDLIDNRFSPRRSNLNLQFRRLV